MDEPSARSRDDYCDDDETESVGTDARSRRRLDIARDRGPTKNVRIRDRKPTCVRVMFLFLSFFHFFFRFRSIGVEKEGSSTWPENFVRDAARVSCLCVMALDEEVVLLLYIAIVAIAVCVHSQIINFATSTFAEFTGARDTDIVYGPFGKKKKCRRTRYFVADVIISFTTHEQCWELSR